MQVVLKIALMYICFSVSMYASAGATCVQKNGLVACGKGKTNLITVNGLAVLKGTKAKSV